METLPCLKDKPQPCINFNPYRRCRWLNIQTCSCLLEDKGANHRDAAEFEARVGELLAQKEGTWEPCCYGQCLYGMVVDAETCGQCRMKHARLVVEAEMEREEACPKPYREWAGPIPEPEE